PLTPPHFSIAGSRQERKRETGQGHRVCFRCRASGRSKAKSLYQSPVLRRPYFREMGKTFSALAVNADIITFPMSEKFSVCRLVDTPREAFVDFWARQYGDELENLYDSNILIKPFTEEAIRALFVWKNGSK